MWSISVDAEDEVLYNGLRICDDKNATVCDRVGFHCTKKIEGKDFIGVGFCIPRIYCSDATDCSSKKCVSNMCVPSRVFCWKNEDCAALKVGCNKSRYINGLWECEGEIHAEEVLEEPRNDTLLYDQLK
ncbi:unnamed protein product [Bursaphelenchus okinawaensis]|uniref:Uncharacterized protein n=1 Tax=Bursaphelenchus okinawaensis TaxID=465554 RepID=A0A811L062_9BILA|nr:unnamed protein product [Bursaphelenchus okinawaensis]CAG9114350.1 unnamed protein product [Bursaphelenchus okinawaensis]